MLSKYLTKARVSSSEELTNSYYTASYITNKKVLAEKAKGAIFL
jgi:hypothetical protein